MDRASCIMHRTVLSISGLIIAVCHTPCMSELHFCGEHARARPDRLCYDWLLLDMIVLDSVDDAVLFYTADLAKDEQP